MTMTLTDPTQLWTHWGRQLLMVDPAQPNWTSDQPRWWPSEGRRPGQLLTNWTQTQPIVIVWTPLMTDRPRPSGEPNDPMDSNDRPSGVTQTDIEDWTQDGPTQTNIEPGQLRPVLKTVDVDVIEPRPVSQWQADGRTRRKMTMTMKSWSQNDNEPDGPMNNEENWKAKPDNEPTRQLMNPMTQPNPDSRQARGTIDWLLNDEVKTMSQWQKDSWLKANQWPRRKLTVTDSRLRPNDWWPKDGEIDPAQWTVDPVDPGPSQWWPSQPSD